MSEPPLAESSTMRIFITGGTGWIGSGIIRELLAANHVVTALARTPAAAAELAAAGATPHMGDLADLAGLRAAAAAADAVIHCAFNHDFSARDFIGAILVRLTRSPYFARVSRAGGTDLHAIEAMIDGLAAGGSAHKVFLCTSPIAGLLPGRVGSERDALDPSAFGGIRIASELATLAAARRGVRSASIRLPPSVHGAGDTGFVRTLIETARRTGVSAYVGSGDNRWSAIHRDDAAALYRRAMEGLADGSVPPGTVLHGVAEQGVAFRELAGAIAERLGLGPAEARKRGHFAMFLGMAAQLDVPASADLTQQLTGWRPTRPGLLADVRSAAYAPSLAEPSRSTAAPAPAH